MCVFYCTLNTGKKNCHNRSFGCLCMRSFFTIHFHMQLNSIETQIYLAI